MNKLGLCTLALSVLLLLNGQLAYGATQDAGVKLPENTIVIEAEAAVKQDRGVEIADYAGASGGKAVVCAPLSKAYYEVTLPKSGTWYVWVRMFCPNGDADSYWLGMDNAKPFPLDMGRDNEPSIRFYSDPGDSVTGSLAKMVWYWDGGKGAHDPKSYFEVAAAGKNRLWVKGREAGTILLTPDQNFNPEQALQGVAIHPTSNEGKIPGDDKMDVKEISMVASTPTAKTPIKYLKNNEEILIWPGAAPGSKQVKVTEKVRNGDNNPNVPNRVITGVANPSLTAFIPEKPNGISVIIMPGGSYRELWFDKEGVEIAKWLNALGISGFILKYRLPEEGHENSRLVPLQDAQRAVRYLQNHAKEWGLAPDKVGVMGFSAGGHLASVISTNYGNKVYEKVDEMDNLSARPDFAVLVYGPVSTDKQATQDTPPTFMVMGDNDITVGTEDNIRYYSALRKAKVPVELHIFAHGSHGFGIRSTGSVRHWTTLFAEWLYEIGI